MKSFKFISLCGLFAIFVIGIGCNNHRSKRSEIDLEKQFIEQSGELAYPIPTPLEISNMLNKSGANFILDITNKSENVDKYFTDGAKALNLGVYGADLSYTATYKKSQETINFLGCTKKLRDALDIQTINNEILEARMENNIDNLDSLYSILTSLYKVTFEYLNDNGKGDISVMVLAGGWIEGLFISTKLASLASENKDIYQGIADQKATLYKLIQLMENYKDNRKVAEILAELKNIKMIFDELIEIDGKSQLTEESFALIEKKINELRKVVVDTP